MSRVDGTFRVAVEATITFDAMTCGGGALVIKRPTDPARFTSATGMVCVTGAAVSGLILEGDKVCFEQSGASRQTVNCDEPGTQFIFYGVTPSETMNDASITLKTHYHPTGGRHPMPGLRSAPCLGGLPPVE